jgi:hypothetical protein
MATVSMFPISALKLGASGWTRLGVQKQYCRHIGARFTRKAGMFVQTRIAVRGAKLSMGGTSNMRRR